MRDNPRVPGPSGKDPISGLARRAGQGTRARIQARVLRFEMGNIGDHKHLDGGVWEARVMFGPGYRVYFGKEGDELVLLLVGGDKGSQRRDIAKALGYWKDYKEREDGKAK